MTRIFGSGYEPITAATYLPHPDNLADLVITWCIAVVLMLAGGVIVGRRIAPELRIGAGWGLLSLLLTAWGVLLPFSLAIPAAAFLLLALSALAIPGLRPRRAAWRTLGRAALVTLPLWLVLAPIRPSQPDTWLNLLPNAFYLVDSGRLPTAALPPSHSYLPAAPYNTQFLSYLGSLFRQDYPAAGMSLVNLLLLLAGGLVVARAVAAPPVAGDAPLPWRLAAGGILLATLLNPGFVPRFHLSAYGETPLAVTAAMAAWLSVSVQRDFAAGRDPTTGTLPTLALVLAAMVNSKQSAIGLVVACLAAAVATSWAEDRRLSHRMLRVVVVAALPAVGLYLLWRWHVAVAGVAELKPLPFALWNWIHIPEILASVIRVIADKGVYFACVLAALVAWPLLLRRQGWTTTTRLLTYHAALFLFYNCFLFLFYIAVFSPTMSEAAHSFFRYNTHLSLVLVLALSSGLRELAPETLLRSLRTRPAGAAVLALALLAPVAFVKRLRFDLEMPQPVVWDLAKDVVPYLHDGGRLALLLPGDNDSVATMLQGVLADTSPRRHGLHFFRLEQADPAAFAEVSHRGYPLALVSCTPSDWPGLPPGEAVLLRRAPQGWRLLAAWPYPSDAAKERWQHILSWPPLCRRDLGAADTAP